MCTYRRCLTKKILSVYAIDIESSGACLKTKTNEQTKKAAKQNKTKRMLVIVMIQ